MRFTSGTVRSGHFRLDIWYVVPYYKARKGVSPKLSTITLLNCVGETAVMHDLGQKLRERIISVAMLHGL